MKAIIDEQLEEVLDKLGVWDDIMSNKVQCAHCGTIISTENLSAFIPRHDIDGGKRIEFYCNAPECINALLNTK